MMFVAQRKKNEKFPEYYKDKMSWVHLPLCYKIGVIPVMLEGNSSVPNENLMLPGNGKGTNH